MILLGSKILKDKIIKIAIIVILFNFNIHSINSTPKVSDVDFIKNGNFELGDTLFYTQYRKDTIKLEGTYAIVKNPNSLFDLLEPCLDHTSNGGQYAIYNGSINANTIVWKQTVKNIKKNNDYQFSFFTTNINPKKPGLLRVLINNDILEPKASINSVTCVWDLSEYIWNSSNADSAEIILIDENLQPFGNDFGIDDISFKPICSVKADKIRDTTICIGFKAHLNINVIDGFPPFKYEWTPNPTLNDIFTSTPEANPLQTTTYYAKVIDSIGCEYFDSVTVKVIDLPTFDITYNKPSTSICPCDSITLSGPTGNLKYLWSTKDTTLNITVKESGIYNLLVINENGCEANSSIKISKLDAFSNIAIDTLSVNIGEKVTFPIRLIENKNVLDCGYTHFKTTIKYNRSMLVANGNYKIRRTNDEEYIDIEDDYNTDILNKLEFTAVLGNDSCTDISIEKFQWNCEDVKVQTFNGKFCLKNICKASGQRLFDDEGKFFLSQNLPNPSTNITEITFGIIEEGISKLVIHDILGNVIHIEAEAYYKPGEYKAYVNTSEFARGVYFYTLKSPSSSITRIMEINK